MMGIKSTNRGGANAGRGDNPHPAVLAAIQASGTLGLLPKSLHPAKAAAIQASGHLGYPNLGNAYAQMEYLSKRSK